MDMLGLCCSPWAVAMRRNGILSEPLSWTRNTRTGDWGLELFGCGSKGTRRRLSTCRWSRRYRRATRRVGEYGHYLLAVGAVSGGH